MWVGIRFVRVEIRSVRIEIRSNPIEIRSANDKIRFKPAKCPKTSAAEERGDATAGSDPIIDAGLIAVGNTLRCS